MYVGEAKNPATGKLSGPAIVVGDRQAGKSRAMLHPGTIATAVAMAALVAGGPALMRYRTGVLLRGPGGRG